MKARCCMVKLHARIHNGYSGVHFSFFLLEYLYHQCQFLHAYMYRSHLPELRPKVNGNTFTVLRLPGDLSGGHYSPHRDHDSVLLEESTGTDITCNNEDH